MTTELDRLFSGVLHDGRHQLAIRVYYEDTDFSGAVYHAAYLRFFERGRTEFLRALGFRQSELLKDADDQVGFVVRRMAVEFFRPAQMDDLVLVSTVLKEVKAASIEFEQQIRREDEILTSCSVLVAAVGAGRARRLPKPLLHAFQRLACGD